MIDNIHIKTLLGWVDNLATDQKTVERKEFFDYLLDKQKKGLYLDTIITFEDEDDFSYFEKLSNNLGYDLADIMINIK